MGFFGFGKKKEKEKEEQAVRQEAKAEEQNVEAEQPAQDEKKQGLFSRLWQGLSKTRGNVAGRVDELIEATEKIDDDFYEDLVDILIMSDMGVRTGDKVIQELKARVEREKITDAKKAREILKDILKEMMSMPRKPLKWPMVMLVVGVNGVGKTTTIGKLAMRFKDARHSVVLAAADTFRAAAGDQLQIWAERAQVPIVRHAEGADPAAVVFDGIQKAKATEADLLIVDTAGRLHNKKNLMEELRKISRIITREYEEAEVRTLLVIDATTGAVVKEAVIMDFGAVISAIVTFLLTALVLFLVVKAINKAREIGDKEKARLAQLAQKVTKKNGDAETTEAQEEVAVAEEAPAEPAPVEPAPDKTQELLSAILDELKAQRADKE